MHINNLKIINLRNHKESRLDFSDSLNVIYGLNGSGKTTILEAISICSFSKSFLNTQDQHLIKMKEDVYFVSLNARNSLDLNYKVSIAYQPGKRKTINNTYGDNLLPKDIIGHLPSVILSPDFKPITFGSPSNRREFIDKILSQSSRKYIDDILELKRILKQRNNILNNYKKIGSLDREQLNLWTDMLIKKSVAIVDKRNRFVDEFKEYFVSAYKKVALARENVRLIYKPYGFGENDDYSIEGIKAKYEELSKKYADSELRRGITLFGPQKDDIDIIINNGLAREIASQGQHKSLLISLKFAEFEYLNAIKNEAPVFLLDDIFSELDKDRIAQVFELVLSRNAQTFITLTDKNMVSPVMPENAKAQYIYVQDGQIGE